MQPGWELRVRALTVRWFHVVVLFTLLTAAVGGWLVYDTYVQPPETTEERVVSTWETTGAFDYRATVRRSNPVYPVGTTLTDRPIYFTTISPRLDGTLRFLYEASEGGSVDLDVTILRRLRAVSTDGTQTYWSVSEPIQATEMRDVEPGQEIAVSFSVNASELQDRIAIIHEALDASPGETEIGVIASVRIRGSVNGASVDERRNYNLTLLPDSSTYEVDGGDPSTTVRREVESVSVPVQPGPLRAVGGPLLLLASVLCLGWIGWGVYRDAISLSAAERKQLEFADDRVEYADFITTGSVPQGLLNMPTVDVNSLEGLVELARDTDHRVIENPARDQYVMIAEDVLYVYEPPVPIDGTTYPLRNRIEL